MFGTLRASKDELSAEELERYRRVYCGLCHALRVRGGQLERLSLSHDLTFVALLLLSLYEPEEELDEKRCAMKPMRKQAIVKQEAIDYAADMTVALAYHKGLDDWHDEGKRGAYVFAKLIEERYSQVRELWPEQCAAIESGLRGLARLEAGGVEGRSPGNAESAETACAEAGAADGQADAGAVLFGRILSRIMVYRPGDFWEETLRALGFELGRFIYLMDAAVDIERDAQAGTFNPLRNLQLSSDTAALRALLLDCMSRVANEFEKLPLVQDAHLLRSVIYAGAWAKFNDTYGEDSSEKGATR